MVYSVFPYEKCCTLYGVIIHQPPAFPATRILFSMNRAVRRCGTAADEMSWQFTAGLTSPKAIRCLQCRRVQRIDPGPRKSAETMGVGNNKERLYAPERLVNEAL